MKILIAVDMEGITGVVSWDQVIVGNAEYPRFCRLMTQDVNAAIAGAFDGGATEVVVTDGHADNRNILIEELDSRARLNTGGPAPLAMVQGIDDHVDGVLLVGYHAQSGSENAILDHTWSAMRIHKVYMNGRSLGEIGLNAAVCGHFGAPVLMIAGDQTACAEARTYLGDVETAVVKRATGRNSAECLPPAASAKLITAAAKRGVERLIKGEAPKPFRLETPISGAIEFHQSEMADKASVLPGARRTDARRIELGGDDMVTAYRVFRAAVGLAR
jgi:D-amino peptidase